MANGNRFSLSSGQVVYTLLIVSKKLFWLAIVLLGITTISFAMIHLTPGSPADLETAMNPMADADARERLMAFYGLDQPLYKQYYDWLSRMIRLDFGNSMSADSRPVLTKIGEALPLTFCLNFASLFLTLLLAIPIGVLSARWRGGLFDKISTAFIFIGFAMPGFWLAVLLISWLAIDLQWLPISGLHSVYFTYLSPLEKVFDLAKHLVMPLFISVFGSLAVISRYMRSSMLGVLHRGFIQTARAKGVPESQVLFKHALGNALLPVITLLGLSIPGLISGSVIIESIFSLPGMGQLFYKAVLARDYSLIMGNLVIGAVLTLFGNLLADICYSLADPRIRMPKSSNRSEI